MKLTLGPIPFHWSNDRKFDFYARIADEAPVDEVYLGEVICSKRAPFFEPHWDEVAERLEKAGKKAIFATLTEVVLKRERKATRDICEMDEREIEINSNGALEAIAGRAHRLGPMMNIYNEATLAWHAGHGATHAALPVELPGRSVAVMAEEGARLGVGIEVQVFGRGSLAVSARCYHARAHNRIKDNCQYVCEAEPDGLVLDTLDHQPFLAINGIQTLSHSYLNLIGEVPALAKMGVTHARLVPHSQDMVAVAETFRAVMDERIDGAEGRARLDALGIPAPFSNGFYHGKPGHMLVA